MNKLPGQISKAAKQDTFKAQLVAERGMEYSEIEEQIEELISTNSAFLVSEKLGHKNFGFLENDPGMKRICAELHLKARADLTEVFLDAVCQFDVKKIEGIAKALKRVISHRETEPDLTRYKLLSVKSDFEEIKNGKLFMGIAEVARLVGWSENKSVDGYSSLRRICKSINFPILDDRKKAPKKFPQWLQLPFSPGEVFPGRKIAQTLASVLSKTRPTELGKNEYLVFWKLPPNLATVKAWSRRQKQFPKRLKS